MGLKFSTMMIDYIGKLYLHERHNSLIYSQISNFLNVQGYINLSKYYEDWSQHEVEHSISVRGFANEQNIILDMLTSEFPNEPEFDINGSSIIDFAQSTVDVENKTSELYNQLLEMAIQENNGFIKDFAYDFLKEQREETDKANTIFDSIKNIGDNRQMLQLYDNTFEYGD